MDFAAPATADGLARWHEQRRDAMRSLAAQMGLPLERHVIVRLRDGVELTGKLRLREEKLFVSEERDFRLELTVDGVSFTAAEIESCVRLD